MFIGNWYVPDESAGLFFTRTLHDESVGHCGNTTIAGNFSLLAESRKKRVSPFELSFIIITSLAGAVQKNDQRIFFSGRKMKRGKYTAGKGIAALQKELPFK